MCTGTSAEETAVILPSTTPLHIFPLSLHRSINVNMGILKCIMGQWFSQRLTTDKVIFSKRVLYLYKGVHIMWSSRLFQCWIQVV